MSCWSIHAFQEKAVKRGETLAEELKASQETSVSQASELHAKEVEMLQNQVDKLEQELSSSKDKSKELEKSVSELQAYKEQAQVQTKKSVCVFTVLFPRHSCSYKYNLLLGNNRKYSHAQVKLISCIIFKEQCQT